VSPDSFLIDPILLFLDGVVLALLWERRWKAHGWSRRLPLAVAAVILAVFYAFSISLWFDLDWVDWMAHMCGAATGRDWMLNSGVFHFDYSGSPSIALDALVVIFFASYTGWLLLGARAGTRLAAARRDHGH
jgi:hypothetical protein